MRRYIAVTVVALLLSACASSDARETAGTPQAQAAQAGPGESKEQADGAASTTPEARQAQQAIAEAEAAAETADAVGYLWRDTEAMIEEARKATEAKEYQKAIQLAAEARRQSEQAYRQYLDQRDAATGE